MQNIMMEKLTPKIIDFGSSITFKQKEFAPFLSGKRRLFVIQSGPPMAITFLQTKSEMK